MSSDNVVALIAVISSIVLTGANLWYQGRQERLRAERSEAEREENRRARIREHWLDTKIALYRQFSSSTSQVAYRIFLRNDPHVRTRRDPMPPFPHEEMRAANEVLRELDLIASRAISEAAHRYFYASTWEVELIYSNRRENEKRRDLAAVQTNMDQLDENDIEIESTRGLFRDLVRAELGLEVVEPAAEASELRRTIRDVLDSTVGPTVED